jgi:hypothetical protein
MDLKHNIHRLLRELTASQLVAIATRSDTGSHLYQHTMYIMGIYCMGVTIISNVRAMPLFIERHVARFQPFNVSK